MKKFIASLLLTVLSYTPYSACSWYDPDYEYFNLFTQNIIRDKAYTPFLLTYSEKFYNTANISIPDDNIEAWRKYFGNQLSYKETEHLVKHIPLQDLQHLKNGKTVSDGLLQKLGTDFYKKYQEAIDYLIEAKYLEPYAAIGNSSNPNYFYEEEEESPWKTVADLNYGKTISALESLYKAAKDPEIKLRYGYQLVRFQHYSHHYQKAVEAFQNYVAPLNLKSAPYYLALDQYAGALRGLQRYEDANWNFFQVFKNSSVRKQSAFISMQLSDSISFENLLKRSQNNDDKISAYFLLGYQDFNNPLPMMEKIYGIDPKSEMLKVLAARAINELERNYLPTYYFSNADDTTQKSVKNAENSQNAEQKKESFWSKIVNFFRNLFGSGVQTGERSDQLSDRAYLNSPNRIPFFNKDEYADYYEEIKPSQNYLAGLESFTARAKDKSDDEFWKIADAYLKFMKKDYAQSSLILSKIETKNPEYQQQISRMKMLNDIVSQPKITPEFEEHLMQNYKNFFTENTSEKDSLTNDEGWTFVAPTTQDFLRDVLANRYFLQGEDAKSFLMNNRLSDFRYAPDHELAKKLEAFYKKTDKTSFEQQIIARNMDSVGSLEAYFNLIYGDFAMRKGDFENAKKHYEKSNDFSGIPVPDETWNYGSGEVTKYQDKSIVYNGFNNISGLVFGHNAWESFDSPATVSMKAENFVSDFPFIQPKMNKLEIADAVLQLKKIGLGKDETAAKANQLIGNLLYNTSVLGYFRELFVMDFNNANGPKFHIGNQQSPHQFYYKNYSWNPYIKPDNFDIALNYYGKALKTSANKEQKARILFQMASAEQGKYYQWEYSQPEISWNDKDWEAKSNARELQNTQMKNQQYRTYFTQLKQQYSDTETAKSLRGSCSYFDYFMRK